MVGDHLEFDSGRFALVDTVDEFVAAIERERRVALRFPTADYRTLRLALSKRLTGPDSAEHHAFTNAEMVCGDCGWSFPGSYRMSLLAADVGEDGNAEFVRDGGCGRCGSTHSLLVYERFTSSDIDQEDVAAIRRSWRDEARVWWAAPDHRSGLCDACSDDIAPGEGYLVARGDLVCARCAERLLSDALPRLRVNPYHLGPGTLRRARAFRQDRH